MTSDKCGDRRDVPCFRTLKARRRNRETSCLPSGSLNRREEVKIPGDNESFLSSVLHIANRRLYLTRSNKVQKFGNFANRLNDSHRAYSTYLMVHLHRADARTRNRVLNVLREPLLNYS
jgi:hypothetical protein